MRKDCSIWTLLVIQCCTYLSKKKREFWTISDNCREYILIILRSDNSFFVTISKSFKRSSNQIKSFISYFVMWQIEIARTAKYQMMEGKIHTIIYKGILTFQEFDCVKIALFFFLDNLEILLSSTHLNDSTFFFRKFES